MGIYDHGARRFLHAGDIYLDWEFSDDEKKDPGPKVGYNDDE